MKDGFQGIEKSGSPPKKVIEVIHNRLTRGHLCGIL